MSSASCRGVELGHELPVRGPGRGQVLLAFPELQAQVDGLLLEVGDPFGQFNSISDPHHQLSFVGRKGARLVSITMQDVYIRANYQDFRRLEGDPKTGAFGRFPASAPRVWDEWPESRAR